MREPVVEFDSHDPRLAENPFPAYHELLRNPVAWSCARGGFWVVSGHDEVTEAARDPALRTSYPLPDGTVQGVSIPPLGQTGRMVPLELDPPESVPYRRTLAAFYSAGRIAERGPEIRDLVAHCLAEAGPECDLVDALTLRVPAVLTLRDIGVPEDRWQAMEETLHRSLLASPDDLPGAREAAQDLCLDLVLALDRPSDLVRALRATDVNGRPMTDEDVVSALFLLLLGIDPTSSVTATALLYLSGNRVLRDRLAADPDAVPRAVDEFLRWTSPVQGTCRTAARQTHIGGRVVQPSERVFLSWASADRDERAYADPDAVDVDRPSLRHLAFGAGVHYCVGAGFAKAMAAEMLTQVLRRGYDVTGDPVYFPDLSSFYGITSLPVRLHEFGVPGSSIESEYGLDR
jgi:cytochrome P450